jgi:hypothetical protein
MTTMLVEPFPYSDETPGAARRADSFGRFPAVGQGEGPGRQPTGEGS